MMLLLPLLCRLTGTSATVARTWSPTPCSLTPAAAAPNEPQQQQHHHHAMSVWFADAGSKIFQHDTAPTTPCGPSLRVSGASGERVTFQLGVRSSSSSSSSSASLRGVQISLSGAAASQLGGLLVRRAAFTNVTTPGNNVTSAGPGMYPDPLPFPNETLVFPEGGGTVLAGSAAVFWLALPIPAQTAAGTYSGKLHLGSTFSADLLVRVRNFTLPTAAHASQWTEADPFAILEACNQAGLSPRPPGCPVNHTDFPHNESPCKTMAVVDAYYSQMADARINRAVWMYH
eukprot:SAG25_NODE_77_length_16915_cov_13.448204_2_plen_287_part_00